MCYLGRIMQGCRNGALGPVEFLRRNVAEALYQSESFLPVTGAIGASLSNEQLKLKAKLKEIWLHLGLVRSFI